MAVKNTTNDGIGTVFVAVGSGTLNQSLPNFTAPYWGIPLSLS
tara:strand:+ start:8114 stop:8242 length:129 start_codon:yes stop_codon:yes gene_type:complete